MLGTGKAAGALNSGYAGPKIQIMNGISGTPTEFYPVDTSGNLVTSTGTTFIGFIFRCITSICNKMV